MSDPDREHMKAYKYVRVGFLGESVEFVEGKHAQFEVRYDLQALLRDGWRPIRKTVVDYHYWKFWQGWGCYPYILVLLEKDDG